MKLAEALLIRADLQNKLNQLEVRLNNNAIVQEGESPAEEPTELFEQLDRTLHELERLITAINLTNARIVKNGKTMTELLAHRDCLKRQISAYRDFLENASMVAQRARGSEIKIKSTVPVAVLQKDIDQRSAALRRLELEIQEMNWMSELCESFDD